MNNAAIQDLNNSLADISSCTDLKKESHDSECGPCPKCGGTDRFVSKNGKYWCRKCHPEAMDKIDFHAWIEGKSTTVFLKERLPKNQPAFRESTPDPDPVNPDIQGQWDQILTHTNEKPVFDLFKRRGFPEAFSQKIFDDGLARFANHARVVSVGFPYFALQGDVLAVQFFTVDGKPYPFTVKNGKPANKVMMKGSAIGQDCFFICGADINAAKLIIIAESVINALTAAFLFPDACCIALGGSTFTNKVKALKPYTERVEKVIVLVDNDDASEKMLRAIWDILVHKVFAFRWNADDPKGYDINDALMAGKRDRIIEIIQGAEQVWYKQDDIQPPASEPDQQEADIWENPVDLVSMLNVQPGPIQWLAHERIIQGRGLLITGVGGSSKTRLLYHLSAGTILGGLPWSWEISSRGRALLVLTEDTLDDTLRTLYSLSRSLGLSLEQKQTLYQSLIVYPLAGEDTILLSKTGTGTLEKSKLFLNLAQKIKDIGNVSFVGMDPALSLTDGDELDQGNQRMLGKMADDLAVMTGAAVGLVTHATKGSLGQDFIGSHSSRGGGAITDAARTEFVMRTMTQKEYSKSGLDDPEEQFRHVQLVATKGNYLPPAAYLPVWLRRDEHGMLSGADIQFDNSKKGPSQKDLSALDILIELSHGHDRSMKTWRDACIQNGIINPGSEGAQNKAMTRIVKTLSGANLILKGIGKGIWVPNTTEAPF